MMRGVKGVRRRAVRRVLSRQFAEKPVVIVVVEGATERRYLQGLRMHHRDMPYNLQIEIAESKHYTDLVEAAVTIRKKYQKNGCKIERTICVGDQEEDGPSVTRKLQDMARLAKEKDITCVVSTPHIEAWFLQHFEKVSVNRSKQSINDRLKKQFLKYRLGPYHKPPKSDIYEKLLPYQATALLHTKHIRHSVKGIKQFSWLLTYLTKHKR